MCAWRLCGELGEGAQKTQQPSGSGDGAWGAAGERREDWIGHGWRGKDAHVGAALAGVLKGRM